MKLLRIVLVLIVVAYAGWLAWPFLAPIVGPLVGLGGPEAARAGSAATLDFGGGLPVTALLLGAVGLYLISALMLGAGSPKAVIAYFLGFLADAALRLALAPGSESVSADIAARSAQVAPMSAVGGVDLQWIVLGVLVVIGLLVLLASRRQRRARKPGHLAY
jgi:hypothetical protein